MRPIITLLSLMIFITSCNSKPSYSVRFRERTCIKEINRSYASVGEAPTSIYKLEQITHEDKLKVSTWYNHSWYYSGNKRPTYFKDTKLFRYKKTNCPDGSDGKASIVDKLKSIDI